MDSFTQTILEKTQARQEILNRNLQSAKRGRQPFSEKQENIEDGFCEQEESPKRLCRDDTTEIQQKENTLQLSPPKTPLRGLAALRQHHFSDGIPSTEPTISSVRRQELEETSSKTETACPKRLNTKLAALATQISQWDSRCTPSPVVSSSPRSPSKSAVVSEAARNLAKKLSAAENSDTNFKSQLFPVKMTIPDSRSNEDFISKRTNDVPNVSDSKLNERPLSEDTNNVPRDIPKPPPLPVPTATPIRPVTTSVRSPAKPPRTGQTPVKKAVWDQAIVATLESQGFTKSPSATKLLYDYNCGSVKNRVENYEAATGTVKAEAKTDPAELPVSAKRALFEKNPELLTVAQKAAMFNKGRPVTPRFSSSIPSINSRGQQDVESEKSNNSIAVTHTSEEKSSGSKPCTLARTPSGRGTGSDFCGISPLVDNSSSPKSTSKAFTPKKVGSSPLKNLGDHTRQMQEMLFSQPQESTTAEIALKQKLERQKEMEALKNRWNRDTAPKFCLDANTKDDQSSSDECTEGEDEDNVGEESYSREANSICGHLDDMLEEALNEGISVSESNEKQSDCSYNSPAKSLYPRLDAYFPSGLPTSPKTETHSPKSPVENYKITTSYKFLTPDPKERTSGISERDVKSEEDPLELIHTISFYRRQKQECATPPMRCIVRREEVVSPPSPKTETISLASHLKTLQEELYKQDVSLRQASQVVALCSSTPEFHSSPQHVEGEKLLLLATLKRNGLKHEIERLKTEAVFGHRGSEDIGILTVSEMRLPLKREFLAAQLENRNLADTSVHHFFCILRYREKVIATEMLNTSDSITAGTFSFTNHICIQGLGGNFVVAFEVYALQTMQQSQEKKGHAKKDHKAKLTPKVKKYEGKTPLSPSCSAPVGVEANRVSNFGLVAQTRFHLENCRQKHFGLEKVPAFSPLEGRLDVKLTLHANISIEEKGFLTIFEDVSGFGAWHRRWFVLSHSKLSFWKYPDEETRNDPIGSIDLKQCVSREVCLVPRDICARPNTFQLLCVRPQSDRDHNTLVTESRNAFTIVKYLLSADTKEERIIWCKRLTESLTSLRTWNTDALRPIEMTH